MLQYLILLGVVVHFFFGVLPYFKNTLRGITKPNRISWLIWAIAPIIGAVAAVTNGVGWAIVPVFMTGFGPLLIFFASFANKNSYWKLGKLDYFYGLLSIFALALWAITKDPITAIIFSIISDALASIPTLIKAWNYPETETKITYLTSLFSVLTSFVAMKTWAFSEYAFSAYLVIANIMLIFAVYRKRIFAILGNRVK